MMDSPVPGVLKRSESNNSSMSGADPKQVMFSDGVKPGGDLAELDGSADQGHRPPRRSSSGTGSSSGLATNSIFFSFLFVKNH